jgi:hypothetical protein
MAKADAGSRPMVNPQKLGEAYFDLIIPTRLEPFLLQRGPS